MKHRKLTAVDVREVSGYSRDQLRGLLDELPPYVQRTVSQRVAREFTPNDLIILSVVFILDQHIGMHRAIIASLIEPMLKTLSVSKRSNRQPRLFLSFDPPSVSYVEGNPPASTGVILSLEPVLERVGRYLRYDEEGGTGYLKFGPVLVAKQRKKRLG